jgi:RNA polymerase sigma-70 factor, ECF subfamily
MTPPDERTLLARIAGGDQHALQCLYGLYRQRLWAYLWHQLDGDSGWTEEVVQDVFLAVWRSAQSYRGEAHVATWLFRIAHNLAANARRGRTRHPLGQPFGAAEDDGEDASMATASLEEPVLARLNLHEALGQLSLKHREVLDLAFAQGFGLEEIAQILSIPVGTVKSRISYARRALRSHLAQAALAEGSLSDR